MPRRGRSITEIVGTIVIVLFFLGLFVVVWNYFAPSWGLSTVPAGQQQQQPPATGMIDVTKQLRVAVLDEYAGSGISSATVNILDSNGLLLETLTTTSGGTATSALTYKSGTSLTLEVDTAGYVHTFNPITVPKMSQADAESLSYIPITIKVPDLPTLAITVMDKNGNTISDSGSFNISGMTTASFTITVVNSDDDSGWKTTYNPIEKVNHGLAVLITPESPLVVTGTGSLVNRGGTTYLVTTIPDSQISRDLRGSTTVGGTYSFTITVNKGTLGSGSDADITIEVWEYFDNTYFTNYGIGGPDAAEATDFTFTIEN